MNLDGHVAIVTGAGRGIGKATAMTLAGAGATVVLTSRTREELDVLATEISGTGGRAVVFPADIGVEREVSALIAHTTSSLGRIDTLVNNAGVGVFRMVADMPVEEFDRMWSVNMRGPFLAIRESLPHMMRAQRGNIINIASLAGKNGVKGGAGYAATKWALRGFAMSLMLEVREHNIRVVTIFPGSVDTAFWRVNRRGDHITQPEDVANAVLAAIVAPQRTTLSEIDLRPTNPA
jgi:3-oxoacyl-[acyl-carrier protein] reductase